MRIKMSTLYLIYTVPIRDIGYGTYAFCAYGLKPFRKKYKGNKTVTLKNMIDFCRSGCERTWVIYQVVQYTRKDKLRRNLKEVSNYAKSIQSQTFPNLTSMLAERLK